MSLRLLSWLIPTYGNWGGPGWSGGTRFGPDWDVPPVDSLDEILKIHDWNYSGSDTPSAFHYADISLLEKLSNLPEDPERWPRPSPYPTYARFYAIGVKIAFNTLVLLRRLFAVV